VKKSAYQPVVEGMKMAVEKGTATCIRTTYPICGKTGTVENPGKDHSAFIGFAPMNDPKIAVSVYIEHGGFGADMAAPIAGLIIEAYLKGKLSPSSSAKAKKLTAKKTR
jgi:penicillin-binding protein 2